MNILLTVAILVWSDLEMNGDGALNLKVMYCDLNPEDGHTANYHKSTDPRYIHIRILCIIYIPVIREHLYVDGSISAVMPKWTLLIAFTANKLPVHSAGLSLLLSLSPLLRDTLLTFASLMSILSRNEGFSQI